MQNLILPNHVQNPNPEVYLDDNFTVLDFETTNRDKGRAVTRSNRIILSSRIEVRDRIMGMGVSVAAPVASVHFGDEYSQGDLLRAIGNSKFIVAHNAKFELQWLLRCGLDLREVLVWDTMLAEYVLAGNRRVRLGLDECAARRGLGDKETVVGLLISGGVCPSEIPEKWLIEYGKQDVLLTLAIFLQQRKELHALGLLPTLYTRCLLTPVLAEIEMNGFQLDEKRVREVYDEYKSKHARAHHELEQITGGINLNSPKQVAGYLYDHLGFAELKDRRGQPDRTEAGGRRTDSDALEILSARATTEAQRTFAETYKKFRPLEVQLGQLEKMLACCEQDEGVLYGVLNQAVTQTHRLSSTGAKYKLQFQNFYRAFKRLFKARKANWLVGEADGAQLEFRIAAHLGRDPVASSDIRNPLFDAHYQTAEQRTRKPRKEITKEERYDAKPHTFKPLFGGMSGTPDDVRYYKFFQEKYNGIYQTQEGWAYTVLREKQLRTETGLIFYWPDTKLEGGTRRGGGYIKNRTSIFNYPIQSLATAEIIPIALVYFWHRSKALKLQMMLVNTIHDSIIAELPPEEEGVFRELANFCFTVDCFRYLKSVYGVRFTVPLGCETKVGDHWGEGKEQKYDLDPDEYFKRAA